jgi:hypothetical protein
MIYFCYLDGITTQCSTLAVDTWLPVAVHSVEEGLDRNLGSQGTEPQTLRIELTYEFIFVPFW